MNSHISTYSYTVATASVVSAIDWYVLGLTMLVSNQRVSGSNDVGIKPNSFSAKHVVLRGKR